MTTTTEQPQRSPQTVVTHCITDTMRDQMPCLRRGEHLPGCDGIEYEWSERDDRWLDTNRACTGCEPRPAVHGLLCGGHWARVDAACKAWPALSDVLHQFDRLVQQEGGTSGHESSVPISATKLAIDEVESHRRSFTGNVDVWVATDRGAAESIRFADAVNRALRTFPTEEAAHRVQVLRCPDCELRTLMWMPPVMSTDNVRIVCHNPSCSYDVDQDTFQPETRTVEAA